MNDLERQTDQPAFLTVQEVAERYRVQVPTIWAWLAEGKLPQPIRLTSKCTRWNIRDLRRFERNLKAEQIGGMVRRK